MCEQSDQAIDLQLQLHPDDYLALEMAARASDMEVENFALLALHRQSQEVIRQQHHVRCGQRWLWADGSSGLPMAVNDDKLSKLIT